MNRTKIEWTDYTWNPVVGCKHGCFYCYARRIGMRFNGNFEPTFHAERLQEPYKLKKPSKIFVCSMADLFGDWVKTNWVERIIKVAKENPQHIFQFLTKNPKRYAEFEFPKNCWLGLTIDGTETPLGQIMKLEELKKKKNYKFISFEPLLGKISLGSGLKGIDLVIVGAMTGPNAISPKKEWIQSIQHKNIFYKNNIKKYLN